MDVEWESLSVVCVALLGLIVVCPAMSLYVIASALSAAPTEDKIAIAPSQGYFMELLCHYWKIRKLFMSSGTMGRPILAQSGHERRSGQ
jgi:hypothetical protein